MLGTELCRWPKCGLLVENGYFCYLHFAQMSELQKEELRKLSGKEIMPSTEKCGYYRNIRAHEEIPPGFKMVYPPYEGAVIDCTHQLPKDGVRVILCQSEDTQPHIRASDGKEIWLCARHSRELNNLKLQHDLRH